MSILALPHISYAEADIRLRWREQLVLVDVSVTPMMDRISFKSTS